MSNQSQFFTLPDGFLCSGVCAGIKTEKGRKDLGLIFCKTDAVAAGVYTRNKFQSAHVLYCKKLTPLKTFRALIINSGNANAATGQAGIQANLEMATEVALRLKVKPDQVLTSSTGIIGRPFPIKTIVKSLDSLIERLENSTENVCQAIMTTDTVPKQETARVTIQNREYSVVGFAKGSGMIHPNMGTMLAYVLTDAPLPLSCMDDMVRRVADKSFNCVSVDGDASTNDSFFLISSNPGKQLSQADLAAVEQAVQKVASSLARQIAKDGEGAKHLMEVSVEGAPSETIVKNVLKAVLTSNLLKCAINGNDPNWGRILAAVGNGLADSDMTQNRPVSISIQSIPVYTNGEPVPFNEAELSGLMKQPEVSIKIDLKAGDYSLTGWGCDFSEDYVKINADYST